MKIYAYCRVSDVSQKEDRQLDAIADLNLPQSQIFVDKQSGKDFQRPSWLAMVKKLRQGDTLHIHSIDRLGRNYDEIQKWWRILTKEKGVDIVVRDMPLLDTRRDKDLLGTLISDLVLNLFSYVAQKERETIRTRQAEGIASAKARGIRFGRPPKKPPENFADLVKQWERGKLPLPELLEQLGFKKTTFYARLREFRRGKKK
ncbi:MAG: recombinase family protein [Defluviitaleaceae bacterium]|nr:recombinase family protein [Defluviitaleaceae bacterium]